MDNDGILF